MFIAFEGPDKAGKSTSADNLSGEGAALYNATKNLYEGLKTLDTASPEVPTTFDRIDWLTHMAYRLAMPDRDWNDDRPRTVFAMPDTHLVFKLHAPDLVSLIEDELYKPGSLGPVNEMYWTVAQWLMGANAMTGFSLFKSITIIEVRNEPGGGYSQTLEHHAGPVFPWEDNAEQENKYMDDARLLQMLRNVDRFSL